MKGKNFSCNNNGKRKKSDFYETPYSITRQFLDEESITGNILEPSCGNGAIVKVLKENGLNVIGKDISQGQNFLEETEKYDAIVTNPPFSLAYEFIQKAKTITDYFAFLLPLSYLHGKKRFDNIYSDREYPLTRVYVFTRYPMLGDKLRDDGKYKTGMMVYAWFVWDKKSTNINPIIKWIDNNSFVLNKDD
jgi:hypothetical protein